MVKENNVRAFSTAVVAFLMVTTTAIEQSRAHLLQFMMVTYPVIAIFMGVLFPLLLAIVYTLSQGKKLIMVANDEIKATKPCDVVVLLSQCLNNPPCSSIP